jgi:hypothetical protein
MLLHVVLPWWISRTIRFIWWSCQALQVPASARAL